MHSVREATMHGFGDYWWFSPRSRDHKIPLNNRYHLFDSRNGYSSVISQVANFWFSSHNCGEVAVIQKLKRGWFQHGRPIQNSYNCGNFWITATLPKLWPENQKLATWLMTELYPFLDSIKWYLLCKEILWWCEVHHENQDGFYSNLTISTHIIPGCVCHAKPCVYLHKTQFKQTSLLQCCICMHRYSIDDKIVELYTHINVIICN